MLAIYCCKSYQIVDDMRTESLICRELQSVRKIVEDVEHRLRGLEEHWGPCQGRIRSPRITVQNDDPIFHRKHSHRSKSWNPLAHGLFLDIIYCGVWYIKLGGQSGRQTDQSNPQNCRYSRESMRTCYFFFAGGSQHDIGGLCPSVHQCFFMPSFD